MADFGYAGNILKIDLSSQKTEKLDTATYAERFIGGKGIAAKLYWDFVPPLANAFDPDNCLICTTGPIAGFSGFASNRWLACGKSAAAYPESFSYGNLGGSWGIQLKYAGYDGLIVQGKSAKPVYLFIHDNKVEIRDAAHLWGKSTFETSATVKAELGEKAHVLTIGQAAENLVVFATLFADEGASGSGGIGSVMGSKMLKAVAVSGNDRPIAADPERLAKLAGDVLELAKGPVPAMQWVIPGRTKTQACRGCGIGCSRQIYLDEKGNKFKSFCQAVDVYRRPAEKYHAGWNEVILTAVRLCDGYGLDSSVMQAMIEWLLRCYRNGILDDQNSGLPFSKAGSLEFIETLTRTIATRKGLGDLLALGPVKAADSLGGGAKELLRDSIMTRSGEAKDYEPRLLLVNSLLLATEPRKPMQQLHEASTPLMSWLNWQNGIGRMSLTPEELRAIAVQFWGSADAADYSTYDGKALAAKSIQDRTYFLESLVLCNMRWPMMFRPLSQRYPSGPVLASQIYSAVTGKEIDLTELEGIGERNFNLQRAILLREGWGGRKGDRLLDYFHEDPMQYSRVDSECIVPDKEGKVVSRKGTVVEPEMFEKMKDEYYQMRGWDIKSGYQTRQILRKLDLEDLESDLAQNDLLR